MATIDHVGVQTSNLDASLRLFSRGFELLGFQGGRVDSGGFHEWDNFAIARATGDRPVTRNLHVAFVASSRAQVDRWWGGLTGAGHRDDGAPGPRPEYSPSYYGAFIRDHDGNSIEAVSYDTSDGAAGVIDHLWVRVRDIGATRGFYAPVAESLGLAVRDRRDRITLVTESGTVTFVEGAPTENLHLAFGVGGEEPVRAFHHAGLRAGGLDNGAPGERPEYHPGYFGAFVHDPDANNVEAVFHDR